MKGIVLGIIGCAIAIGTSIFLFSKLSKKSSEAQSDNFGKNMNCTNNDSRKNTQAAKEYKSEIIRTMEERHKVAANIIRESIDKINDNSSNQSEHEDEFVDIFDDLDDLMSEE